MEKINWRVAIINGLIIWFISFVTSFVVGFGYSFIVGFQTRGDSEAIAAAGAAIGSSILFQAVVWVAYAAAAYWRGGKIAESVESADDGVPTALVAGAVTLVLPIILEILSPGNAIFYLFITAIIVLGVLWFRVNSATQTQ